MENLNTLERAVLDKLLSGDHPILATLRMQAENARLAGRDLTGVGFFCSFEVQPDAPTLKTKTNFHIADVNAELEGLAHGAGFALFIRNGRLDTLEGFSYDEPWPNNIGTFTLSYMEDPRNLPKLLGDG